VRAGFCTVVSACHPERIGRGYVKDLNQPTVQIDLRWQGASPVTEIMAGKRPARRLFCRGNARSLDRFRCPCRKQQSL